MNGTSDYRVAFSGQSRIHCVGVVDMVNSTKISAQIGSKKSAIYYQIFLNSMSEIIFRCGGNVIKNAGDCLFYYFPDSDKPDKTGLANCIKCGLAMINSQNLISEQLVREGLPDVDFRISADYGSLLIMKSNYSKSLDMIGPPLNMCSKINHLAGVNQFVIGGDLFQMVRDFKGYQFKEITAFSLGFKMSYPVYSVFDK